MPLKDLKDEGHGEKREFHAGPVVRTWCFYCHGPGSTPSQGAKIPQTSNVAKKKKKMRGKMDKLPMIAIEQGVLVEKCAKVGHLT